MPGRLVQAATRARNLKRKIARDRADALAALVSEGASVAEAGARMGLTKGETARRRRRLYRSVRRAAERGEHCPDSKTLAFDSGYSPATIGGALVALRDLGLTEVEIFGKLRVVTICETGQKTREPRRREVARVRPKRPVREIARTVVGALGICEKDVLGRSRFKEHVRPRQIIFALSEREGWSLSHIGRVMGYNHTTVLYAREMLPEYVKRDPALARTMRDLMEQLPPLPERLVA